MKLIDISFRFSSSIWFSYLPAVWAASMFVMHSQLVSSLWKTHALVALGKNQKFSVMRPEARFGPRLPQGPATTNRNNEILLRLIFFLTSYSTQRWSHPSRVSGLFSFSSFRFSHIYSPFSSYMQKFPGWSAHFEFLFRLPVTLDSLCFTICFAFRIWSFGFSEQSSKLVKIATSERISFGWS